MNIFVLTTGRAGSAAFINACKYISNYSSGHESLTKKDVWSRFSYPSYHIESDNRLSWFLGMLDKKYSNNDFYIHLKRDKVLVADSFNHRWYGKQSIIRGFAWSICGQNWFLKSKKKRLKICEFYIETIESNIELFLKDKENVMSIQLENIESDFTQFWKAIGANGDLKSALNSFSVKTNKRRWYNK